MAGLVVLVGIAGLVSWWAVTNLGQCDCGDNIATKVARPSAEQQPAAGPTLTLLGETVDLGRLYDPAFENDPQIQRLAGKTGVSAACLIASWKMALYQEQIPDAVCAGNLTSTGHKRP